MVFSSLLFAFFFLPAVLGLYYLAKDRYRNYVLLAASLLFYAYGEPRFVFVMLASIVLNYVLALGIAHEATTGGGYRKNLLLGAAVAVNLGLLFTYKYLSFAVQQLNKIAGMALPVPAIMLPIGISFFTFQALSYVIDVWRGTVPVQRNPFYLALYISFFPQLIAGPIVRYSTIEEQLRCRRCTPAFFAEGVHRFFLGFCKKVLLANNLALVAQAAFGLGENVIQANPLFLWLGSLGYTMQIYYDFSGYSDMAIGLGRMFGFRFEENFNYPYISRSVTEFWRRWHISLGQWFRDYVYIPLGGSRVSRARNLFNLLVVWTLTGLWHGAARRFIAWGLGYFLLLAFEKTLIRPDRLQNIWARSAWRVVTLLCVNFGWVIFNADSLGDGIHYCLAMLGVYGVRPVLDVQVLYYGREYGAFVLAGILLAVPLLRNVNKRLDSRPVWAAAHAVAAPLGYTILFLWSVSFLILGAHNPFLYFNF